MVSLEGDLTNERGATVEALAGGTGDVSPTGGENDGTMTPDGATSTVTLT